MRRSERSCAYCAASRPRSRSPVAWVQGRNTAPLESLANLPFTVTRMDYLGDLDAAGLAIAQTACAIAQRAAVPAGPAESLWQLLVTMPTRVGGTVPEAEADRLVAWLPPAIRAKARAVLLAGRAIPQEALRYDILVDDLHDPRT